MVRSAAIHLHLILYEAILAFTLKGIRGLINTVAFRELSMLFILEIFNLAFIDQFGILVIHIYSIYMNKEDLVSNNLQWLISHKPDQTN